MGSDVGGKPAGSSRDGSGAASTSKRRRIESLEQRFAGRGAPSSSAASATRRPVGGAGAGGGRGGARPDRLARDRPGGGFSGPRAGGRGAPPARPRDDRAARPDLPRRVPEDDPSAPDAVWYAPLGPRARAGVMATAHARAVPPDLTRRRDDADPFAARAAASAWVLGLIRELAATNPKAGADVEKVIQSKTKDKSLLLDAANARFSVDDVRAAKERRETRERRRGGSASATATRARSGAPIIPIPGDGDGDVPGDGASLDALFAPLRECWWSYASGTVEGCGGDARGRAEAARRVARGDVRGAVATVSSCRDPGLTGTRGTIVRDTARTLWMVEVGDRNKVVKVPKRGTTFAVEAPAPKRGDSSDKSGGKRSGPAVASGGGASTMTVTIRGDDLARVG